MVAQPLRCVLLAHDLKLLSNFYVLVLQKSCQAIPLDKKSSRYLARLLLPYNDCGFSAYINRDSFVLETPVKPMNNRQKVARQLVATSRVFDNRTVSWI